MEETTEHIYIDHSVYPDRSHAHDLITTFETDIERADYVERICAAWDFDIRPEKATFALFRDWKHIFDEFPLLHSPAYHTFRAIFGWEDMPKEGGTNITPIYVKLDRLEGRTDPCENMI